MQNTKKTDGTILNANDEAWKKKNDEKETEANKSDYLEGGSFTMSKVTRQRREWLFAPRSNV